MEIQGLKYVSNGRILLYSVCSPIPKSRELIRETVMSPQRCSSRRSQPHHQSTSGRPGRNGSRQMLRHPCTLGPTSAPPGPLPSCSPSPWSTSPMASSWPSSSSALAACLSHAGVGLTGDSREARQPRKGMPQPHDCPEREGHCDPHNKTHVASSDEGRWERVYKGRCGRDNVFVQLDVPVAS